MIKLTHVSKSFDGGRSYAVNDLSLSVDRGETLVLLGSSGCGKTTARNMRVPSKAGKRIRRFTELIPPFGGSNESA